MTGTVLADHVKLVVQQNKAGISEGDIIELPGGQLALVASIDMDSETAQLEPLGVERAELDKNARRFRDFAGIDADRVEVYPAQELSGAGWKLGDLCGVLYEADFEGQRQLFYHPFRKQSRPTLAVFNNGLTLVTLGGAFQVGERGIVDS